MIIPAIAPGEIVHFTSALMLALFEDNGWQVGQVVVAVSLPNWSKPSVVQLCRQAVECGYWFNGSTSTGIARR
ncbi:MAG: hypothetical protein R3C26_09785 [Calditrichia bacterium]